MSNEKRFVVLLSLVLILLLTNWLTWSTTRAMQSDIKWLQGNLNNLHSSVSGEVSGIRGVVKQMKDDARWWEPAEAEFLDVNKDEAQVKISWSLREYRAGSQVMLNYQKPGEQEYIQIAAKEEAKGRFYVNLPVAVPREPVINVNVKQVGDFTNSKAPVEVEESLKEARVSGTEDLNFTYYISVQEGQTIRTSERHSLSLGSLNYQLFSPLIAEVRLMDNGEIEASVHYELVGSPHYELKEIYLESRTGEDTVLEKWPLEREHTYVYPVPAGAEGFLYLKPTSAKDYDSLFLVINYSDNLKVERKIL
ncbi:MAG: hypothetical protein VR67_04945 [Peptococcaceae bacterium BRH_c8a]|nr:MAG: hypothetical protein VR67_04945 [Peptococcaceae bacterium BRH_c8a]